MKRNTGIAGQLLHRCAAALAACAACGSGCIPSLAETPSLEAGTELKPGLHQRAIDGDGRSRTFSLYLPAGEPPPDGWPLVLILHGSGERGRDHLEGNGWIAKADESGFVALAPDALPLQPRFPFHPLLNPSIWNGNQPYLTTERAAIDDVSFLDAVQDELAAGIPIDRSRVFVAGHSSGGAMTFRLLAEQPGRFAGASVLASACWLSEPHPVGRVPMLYIVGTADPIQPIDGGAQRLLWLDRVAPPVSEILADWARASECDPQVSVLEQNDDVIVASFGTCADDTPLRAIFVLGEGHYWPGGRTPRLPEALLGPRVSAFNATDRICEFFGIAARPNRDSQ